MFQDDLQTKSQKVTKTFSSMFISVDSPEQDIIVYNIAVIIAKKNQINTHQLKTLTVSFKPCLSILNFLQ